VPVLHKARNPGLWTPKSTRTGAWFFDRSHPLARGMTSYYAAGVGDGLMDLTGNAGRATPVGSPTRVPGPMGGPAWEFNGSSQYLDLGSAASFYGNTTTLAAVCTPASSSGSLGSLIGRWFGSGSWGVAIQVNSNLTQSRFGVSGSENTLGSDFRFTANRTFSVVGTFDATASTAQVWTGNVVNTLSSQTLAFSSQPMSIGAVNSGGSYVWYFAGLIHVAATWSRALSMQEAAWFDAEPYSMLIPAG
jgi:hypothetical protein